MSAAPEGATTAIDREKFLSLYPHRQTFIWKLPEDRHWRKASGPLKDFQILGVISDAGRGQLRGCYWAERTRFAVLDVDQDSKYHNEAELAELTGNLASVGLALTRYQSSSSGGWHLYIFFDQAVSSKEVNRTLKAWLRLKSYEIKSGVLEVFPSGNALRLPLQPGFAWLDAGGAIARRRDDIEESEALASFLADMKRDASSWGEAKIRMDALIEADRKEREKHQQAISLDGLEHIFNSGKIEETWQKGREWWERGLFAKGQRHDAVLALGHYLWYGDPARNIPAYPGAKYDRARARIIEEWLRRHHNGMCRHINEGRWDSVIEQIDRAVIWRGEEKKTRVREPYPLSERLLKRLLAVYRKTGQLWEVSRLEAANNFREEEARARIKSAVNYCLEEQIQISQGELRRLSGCHPRTLRKHDDLWRPLAAVAGVYITWGVRGGLEACDLLAATDDQNSQNPDFLPSSLWESDTLALVDQPGVLSGEEKKEILPSWWKTQGSSLILTGQPDSLPASQVAVTGDCADGASAALVECLTPFVEEEAGRRRTTDGITSRDACRRTSHEIITTGSSTDLEGLGYACGISSLALLAPVFLGDIYLSGLRSGHLRHEGGAAGSVGEEGPVCYTACDIAGGIKEMSGKPSGKSVLASFRAKRGSGNIIPDANNHILLTTRLSSYPSGFPDEFSLIQKSRGPP
ncbi:MAG: hypothetical protein GC158_13660 [Cyanobacteria bacterium RI_101]|nr:hypothetical protein [Cyanobacteria bacterium RI_101]